jgi:serine/threonine protein kinase
MSYCLSLNCSKPQNLPGTKFCITCGTKLLLGDRYRAIKPIGQGGFSKTFLGVDEYKPSQPRCVIKKFDYQGAGSQKAAELFEQEAVRLDELGKHPQIPELLAHFEQEQSNYLVQEFIDGQNLAEELETTGTFDEDKVCKLLNELLPVLEFIHSCQVIHRDIKPENIIRPSSGGKAVLVDFGAAKFVTGLTQMSKGTRIGTPDYVAPEQSKGKAQFSSDLYSLGATCLHLLTQMNPNFDLCSGSDWVWRDYLLNPVSDSLGYILDKMLEQEAHQRYQSAKDILKELNQAAAAYFYEQGRQKAERGKYREAIDDFNHAIHINPSYAEAYYLRGIAYSRLRENQKAIAYFQKAAELYHQQGKKADSQKAQDKISQLNSLKHTLKSLDIDSQRLVAKQIFSSGADSIPDHLLVGKIYGFWETITCSERKYSSVTHWNIIDFWKESLLEIIQKLNVSQHYQKDKDLVISNLKSLKNDYQLKENLQTLTKEFFGLMYDSFNEKEKDDFLEKIVEDLQANKVVNKEELKKAGLKGILFGAAGLPALLIPVVSKIMLQKMTQGLLAYIMINLLGREALKKAALGFLGGPIGWTLSIGLTALTGLAAFSQYKKEEQKAKFIQSILAVYLLSI